MSWQDLSAKGWRKSSFSSSNGGNCVMTRARAGVAGIAVGDTKNPAAAPLEFTPAQWATFTASLKR